MEPLCIEYTAIFMSAVHMYFERKKASLMLFVSNIFTLSSSRSPSSLQEKGNNNTSNEVKHVQIRGKRGKNTKVRKGESKKRRTLLVMMVFASQEAAEEEDPE